jgi:hypothetical protein
MAHDVVTVSVGVVHLSRFASVPSDTIAGEESQRAWISVYAPALGVSNLYGCIALVSSMGNDALALMLRSTL